MEHWEFKRLWGLVDWGLGGTLGNPRKQRESGGIQGNPPLSNSQ